MVNLEEAVSKVCHRFLFGVGVCVCVFCFFFKVDKLLTHLETKPPRTHANTHVLHRCMCMRKFNQYEKFEEHKIAFSHS